MACAGTFGRVLECWDRKREDYVAIKIVRNIDKYRHAAMIEVRRLGRCQPQPAGPPGLPPERCRRLLAFPAWAGLVTGATEPWLAHSAVPLHVAACRPQRGHRRSAFIWWRSASRPYS